jgi:hypothetical protein
MKAVVGPIWFVGGGGVPGHRQPSSDLGWTPCCGSEVHTVESF